MLGESNPKFSKTLMENGDNSRPGISFAHVPSQSSEMAEKLRRGGGVSATIFFQPFHWTGREHGQN